MVTEWCKQFFRFTISDFFLEKILASFFGWFNLFRDFLGYLKMVGFAVKTDNGME